MPDKVKEFAKITAQAMLNDGDEARDFTFSALQLHNLESGAAVQVIVKVVRPVLIYDNNEMISMAGAMV
jgi:hypothetical protein